MTNMKDEGFKRFGVVTVCISVPTYWLLILISWREKLGPLEILVNNKCRALLGKKATVGVVRRSYKSKDRKHLKATQKNAINASLQHRLTSMSFTQGRRGLPLRWTKNSMSLGMGRTGPQVQGHRQGEQLFNSKRHCSDLVDKQRRSLQSLRPTLVT